MIVCADAVRLPLKDQSVDGIITSPPYNCGKHYPGNGDALPYQDYTDWLGNVYRECRRVSRGPVCFVLPLMMRGHFVYAEVGTWEFVTPIVAGSEAIMETFGRGWTRAYVGVELMVCTEKPKSGVWIVFAPKPFIGDPSRNRPRHPAPFVREVPAAAFQMFPDVQLWCDPFGGTGTTLKTAKEHGKRCVSLDLAHEYCRVQQDEVRQGILV